jgi:hypothetical protein
LAWDPVIAGTNSLLLVGLALVFSGADVSHFIAVPLLVGTFFALVSLERSEPSDAARSDRVPATGQAATPSGRQMIGCAVSLVILVMWPLGFFVFYLSGASHSEPSRSSRSSVFGFRSWCSRDCCLAHHHQRRRCAVRTTSEHPGRVM